MSTVLYVVANPKPVASSYTLRLAESFLENYKKNHPSDLIETLDLYRSEIQLIDYAVTRAWDKSTRGESLTEAENKAVTKMNAVLDQFLAADKVIIAAPMWNFGFPPMVKAYIDNLVIAGKTFKYTAQGPVGLLSDKPVLLVQSRGGKYGELPMKSFEMTESYLRNVFAFLGIKSFHSLLCEGVNFAPDKADEFLNAAKEKGMQLAKSF